MARPSFQIGAGQALNRGPRFVWSVPVIQDFHYLHQDDFNPNDFYLIDRHTYTLNHDEDSCDKEQK